MCSVAVFTPLPPGPHGALLAKSCELFPGLSEQSELFSDAVLCDSIRDVVAAFSPIPEMSIKSRRTNGIQRGSVRFGAEKSAATRFRQLRSQILHLLWRVPSSKIDPAVECAATEFSSRPSVAALGTRENLSEIVHNLVNAVTSSNDVKDSREPHVHHGIHS